MILNGKRGQVADYCSTLEIILALPLSLSLTISLAWLELLALIVAVMTDELPSLVYVTRNTLSLITTFLSL